MVHTDLHITDNNDIHIVVLSDPWPAGLFVINSAELSLGARTLACYKSFCSIIRILLYGRLLQLIGA